MRRKDMNIEETLLSFRDDGYKNFHKKLMPSISEDLIIGIRVPVLRKFAKEIYGTKEAEDFVDALPHKYYEENNLHAFLLERIPDFETALAKTEAFLPHIDNWATCDSFLPGAFKKNRDKLLPSIRSWLKSDKPYTVRYAIGLLMSLYLDDCFDEEYMLSVACLKSDEYYVRMMQAWYFATALAKQYDCAVKYLTGKKLDPWVHNKTIQKAIESRRITNKEYLKTLKINGGKQNE